MTKEDDRQKVIEENRPKLHGKNVNREAELKMASRFSLKVWLRALIDPAGALIDAADLDLINQTKLTKKNN